MTTPIEQPADWPLGERQMKAKFYYNDDADLIGKMRWIADRLEAGDNKVITEHAPWFAASFNCCGGSPP